MSYNIAKECTVRSDEGSITFPEVLALLTGEGIEMYYADLLASTKTYYKGSEAYVVECKHAVEKNLSSVFDSEKIEQAVRLSQTGQIQYQEFVKRALEAGVLSYAVFINGRKVVYFGKLGEQHVELFPSK